MKKIIGIVVIALMSASTYAQTDALDKYFSNYQQDENFTKVNISGKMFDLASFLESDDNDVQEFKDLVSGVESLKMLMNNEIGNSFDKYKSAVGKVQGDFEELMSVDDKDGKATFFINEKNGIVREFVAVAAGDSALCIVSVMGNIDLKKLGAISRKLQTEGFQFMDKMEQNGASEVKVYPNPASKDGEVLIDIPAELDGAQINFYSANGSIVKTLKASGSTITVGLGDFKSGQYFIELKKDGTSIKKKLFVN
tara:strand:+ start:7587 stop:8345 length:759 start_codon:yes stop_codon:yes gene_type:complete